MRIERSLREFSMALRRKIKLASFIFRLNALENSLKDRSILIFDQHTPPFDLFRSVSTNLLKK